MAKYKAYDYDQTMLVPVSLTGQLMPGTLEYAIHYLVENRINMSIFESRYKNDETGSPAYDPKILLKVILMGYSRGLIGSRRIETACRENIIFMALCCGKVPDYSTLCNFVKSMQDYITSIFRDILLVCEKEGLLGGTRFALDGCKLPSNASQDWTGTHAQLQAKMRRMEKKVKQILKKHINQDKEETDSTFSESERKKVERLDRHIQKIQAFLESTEPKSGSKKQELKSNVTDNDSAQMKTPHGSIQGYNAQALTDSKHQIIVSSEAIGNGQDHDHLTPMIDQAKENIKALGQTEDYFEGKEILCDASYHSQENLGKSIQENMDAYIPDVNYRKRDPRLNEDSDIPFSPADFEYDETNDQYICPNRSRLSLKSRNYKKGKKLYRLYVADEASCSICPLRKRCLASGKTKRRYYYVYANKEVEALARQMYKKFNTQQGRAIYDQRAVIVEPVFANIRTHKRLDRFTFRGACKVNVQWKLYTIVHNIEKIVKYGSENAFNPVLT
jgi:transposase